MDITAHPKKIFDFDVVVIGGGTTAVCAALAAAEAAPALKVAIIEKNGFLGGTAALGLPRYTHTRRNRTGVRMRGGDNLKPRALDIKKLQKLLISQCALLEPMEETKC